MPWLLHRTELTVEQLRATELKADRHRVVFGAPGSGKTQILLHRAAFLRDRMGSTPERFRVFVFTNVLKQYIRSAVDLLDIPQEAVLTFDDWCGQFYREHLGKPPWDSFAKRPDFSAIREGVLRHLSSRKAAPRYDFVMVDEGQDLDRASFDILRLVAGHVTVCMDNKQQIFDQGTGEAEVLSRLGLTQRSVALLSAFRCCPHIVKMASALLDSGEEREAFLSQSRTYQTEKQKPLLYLSQGPDDETRRLVEAIKTRQSLGEKVAVLYPTKRLLFGYASALAEAGLEVEVPSDRGKGSRHHELDFGSGRPKLMTYHSAKGLTFDSVIMPRLFPQGFNRVSEAMVKRLLFVGLTRATKWACLLSPEDNPLPALDSLRDQRYADSIEVQTSNDRLRQSPATSVPKSAGGLGDLL